MNAIIMESHTSWKAKRDSVISSLSQIQSKRAGGWWAAPWFTIPQLSVKILQVVLAVLVIILVFVWTSEGETVLTLNTEDKNYRNEIYYYVALSCVTVVYAAAMIILGCAGLKMPSVLLVVSAGIVLLLWIIASPVMSNVLQVLDNSVFARKKQLNTVLLMVATIFGFVEMVVFTVDVLLGLLALRNSEESSRQLTMEMEKSRSVISSAACRECCQQSKSSEITVTS